jgi:hypothetical protein
MSDLFLKEGRVRGPGTEETVSEALDAFKRTIHDGGDVAELEKGLVGLADLMEGASVSENLAFFVETATTEAIMRISLMRPAEEAARQKILMDGVKNLENGFRQIHRYAKQAGADVRSDPKPFLAQVTQRVERRHRPH